MVTISGELLNIDFEDASVSFWHHKEGESIAAGDPLLELMSAKAVIVIESPVSGVLQQCLVKVDDIVNINTALAEIAETKD